MCSYHYACVDVSKYSTRGRFRPITQNHGVGGSYPVMCSWPHKVKHTQKHSCTKYKNCQCKCGKVRHQSSTMYHQALTSRKTVVKVLALRSWVVQYQGTSKVWQNMPKRYILIPVLQVSFRCTIALESQEDTIWPDRHRQDQVLTEYFCTSIIWGKKNSNMCKFYYIWWLSVKCKAARTSHSPPQIQAKVLGNKLAHDWLILHL